VNEDDCTECSGHFDRHLMRRLPTGVGDVCGDCKERMTDDNICHECDCWFGDELPRCPAGCGPVCEECRKTHVLGSAHATAREEGRAEYLFDLREDR
jgi:hypothetical protein